jgi:hypothetical protein
MRGFERLQVGQPKESKEPRPSRPRLRRHKATPAEAGQVAVSSPRVGQSGTDPRAWLGLPPPERGNEVSRTDVLGSMNGMGSVDPIPILRRARPEPPGLSLERAKPEGRTQARTRAVQH